MKGLLVGGRATKRVDRWLSWKWSGNMDDQDDEGE